MLHDRRNKQDRYSPGQDTYSRGYANLVLAGIAREERNVNKLLAGHDVFRSIGVLIHSPETVKVTIPEGVTVSSEINQALRDLSWASSPRYTNTWIFRSKLYR